MKTKAVRVVAPAKAVARARLPAAVAPVRAAAQGRVRARAAPLAAAGPVPALQALPETRAPQAWPALQEVQAPAAAVRVGRSAATGALVPVPVALGPGKAAYRALAVKRAAEALAVTPAAAIPKVGWVASRRRALVVPVARA